MDHNQKGEFSLKLIQKCPICNYDYHQGRIEILNETEKGFLAYLTCGVCSSSIIVKVMTMPHGLIGNAILTDLTPVEVAEFSKAEKIGSNNVLELHQLISNDRSFIDKIKKYS